ncbi:SagD family biosynthesis docking scaffold protein [Reticulibacter mediterranei]|uniref:SagD family biosynthesis docking scaffold protein n=1 Tax=Reticulibacter mediterranei TaxID=2778369 RepID=A0A8J3N8H4_9CHLR|nr:TOMM precursor leader peptide-binding protein [Reticulibacter mediterranei]GHO99698.1 SagD family biosynthesis docking scaffold protein [Reticulibacter mediterranei]
MNTNKEIFIGLIGQGCLAQRLQRQLAPLYQIIPMSQEAPSEQFAACTLIVYVSDYWASEALRAVNRCCLQAGIPLLPVYTRFGEGILGPWVTPGEKGCISCTQLRVLGATEEEDERELIQQYLSEEYTFAPQQSWLTSFSLEVLMQLACSEIGMYLHTPEQARARYALLSLSLETLAVRRHHFLAVSHCPDCAEQTDDKPEMAEITLQSCPKPEPFIYRIQHSPLTVAELCAEYVDARAGLIQSLDWNAIGLLPKASAHLRTVLPDGEHTTNSSGCSLRPVHSGSIAILEAIERYAGLRPRSKRTVVHGSYHQLGSQALDPTTLGLHSAQQYALSGYRFVPYHHDLVCNWVWGYSFQRQCPILVPERSAYYALPVCETSENPPFAYETSNGCALGRNLEEAIFHGILEVVERDAFLLTWYAQLRLPCLDPRSVADPAIRLLIEHIEHRTGYTIRVFNATLDHAFPCLWVIGIDEKCRDGLPKVRCAAGSHLHPELALQRALRELSMFLSRPPAQYQQKRQQALEMLADPDLVKILPDHPLLYCLPEAFDRLSFLDATQSPQTFQEAFSAFYCDQPMHLDLRDDLFMLLNYYLKRNIDCIVVDQTAPEYATWQLRSVKILMPGMLQMTFGHRYRRITGIERLHRLPVALGYRDHLLTEAEINPYPHPFS